MLILSPSQKLNPDPVTMKTGAINWVIKFTQGVKVHQDWPRVASLHTDEIVDLRTFFLPILSDAS
jgi:hypothetical protein